MKKLYIHVYLLTAISILNFNKILSQPQCYLQLSSDNSKIIFQILPDKNYTDVAIYVNFYDNANNPIKLNSKFGITSYEHKYLLQSNGVYSFILNHSFKDVASISLGGIYEKVPSLGLQKNGNNTNFSVDDGDMTLDASYASAINPQSLSNPLQDITLAENNINDPCKNSSMLQLIHQSVVKSSYKCDLENSGSNDGDFWWSVENKNLANIVPQNGARFYSLGNCTSCFETINCQTLRGFDMGGLFSSNSISTQNLSPGTVITYITRNNLYGKMKIENILLSKGAYSTGLDLKISFETFAN